MSVKVVTDSTSYIAEKLIKEYDISIASLNVILNGKSYKEIDLSNREFYEQMDKNNEIPTSSQPSTDELFQIFKEKVVNGDDVVGIFLSSKMSGTYSNSHLVREMILEEYPNAKIELIDSTTNCMQMGYQVIQAAKSAKAGNNISEVVNDVLKIRENSRFLFVPDTLKYLKKGGRIGGASALFGTILQIKPILTVENGETTVFNKVRTKKKAIDTIVDKVLQDVKEKGLGKVIVHHINCENEGLELARRLEGKLGIPVTIQHIGPIIGLHVGPGSIGVAYYTES
ncbi:DegV family protein [Clostridium weizhouense]|uniref:DegV family protein n=1 Tax=Clostridium weizhouense TaxID=2859781 RepID=A0ABS7ANY3_9CLOT|nr:DegV family protein [Clostridium weizhouense]MBW6409185.1 DegV family protein [Clostridium weizhouense]